MNSITAYKQKNVNTDYLINSMGITEKYLFRNKMKSVLSKRTQETIWNEVLDLKEQCGIIKFLVNMIPTKKTCTMAESDVITSK